VTLKNRDIKKVQGFFDFVFALLLSGATGFSPSPVASIFFWLY